MQQISYRQRRNHTPKKAKLSCFRADFSNSPEASLFLHPSEQLQRWALSIRPTMDGHCLVQPLSAAHQVTAPSAPLQPFRGKPGHVGPKTLKRTIPSWVPFRPFSSFPSFYSKLELHRWKRVLRGTGALQSQDLGNCSLGSSFVQSWWEETCAFC